MATTGTIYNSSTGAVVRLISNIKGITEANLKLKANEAFYEGHYPSSQYVFSGGAPVRATPAQVVTPLKTQARTKRQTATTSTSTALQTIIDDTTVAQSVRDAFQVIRDREVLKRWG